MPVTVRIPTPLQRLTKGQGEVTCQGGTVAELLADLERAYPGIKERICDEHGKLRRFVNVFVNEEDIRFLQGDQSAVKDGDEVSIIPAIAGGAASGGVVRKQVTLIFPQHLIKEPVIYTMAKDYQVIPNIRRARVTESVGEMTLELEGTDENVKQGIAFLEKKGIKVEPLVGDVVS